MDLTDSKSASVEAKKEITKAFTAEFKKPILIGKIGKFPRKIVTAKNIEDKTKAIDSTSVDEPKNDDNQEFDDTLATEPESIKPSLPQSTDNCTSVPYKEPTWSGLPSSVVPYTLEVLKSGIIVDRINLTSKSFWVFGRATNCDIYMAHPTISRYHAVMQYRSEGTENNPSGFYIYDLNSTHGTFFNKNRIRSRIYVPVKVGHMVKLGFSSRSYILTGPEEDEEKESEFSVTELRRQRAEKLQQQELEQKETLLKEEKMRAEKHKQEEERGIDWGLGEDADEEADLAENPYAQTNNEELYLDDPKKALRGFMEREGHDLEYNCTEQGFGQFLCKVELPIDDDFGHPIVAEVLHKGKKKEAVIQCALEACRILDRHGLLRQATHESRKRKVKNWEDNDYYDSDDDTFLDRTGTIEKKREKRMKAKLPQQPETYQSLLEREKQISQEIARIEKELSRGKGAHSSKLSDTEEDTLDSFMKELKDTKLDKHTISKLKSELVKLKTEHVNVVKLVNLTKPADLPPLVIDDVNRSNQQSTGQTLKSKALPMIGKRLKVKVQLPKKDDHTVENMDAEQEVEEDEDESVPTNDDHPDVSKESAYADPTTNSQNKSDTDTSHKVPHHLSIHKKIIDLEKLIGKHRFPLSLESYIVDMKCLLQNIKDIIEVEGKIQSDRKTIIAKNIKMKKHIDNLYDKYDENNLVRIVMQLQRIYIEIQDMTEKQHGLYNKLRILNTKIDLFCKQFLQKIDEINQKSQNKNSQETRLESDNDELIHSEDEDEDNKEISQEELEKRKKRNQKRIQQRKEKAEKEKRKGYEEDAHKADYNMWIPPNNQTGDGRTCLNEKFGY